MVDRMMIAGVSKIKHRDYSIFPIKQPQREAQLAVVFNSNERSEWQLST